MTSLRRLRAFINAVFNPPVYGTYAILWVLALESSAQLLGGQRWRPGPGTVVRAASVLLALLYLRIVDEQKDLEYDRVHNPDRPLVRGAISTGELRVAMNLIATVLVALNIRGPAPAGLVLLAVLGYALLLVVLERLSPRVRDGLLLNLTVTYPVQLLISVYLYLSTGQPVRASTVPLIAIFACAFLHFEFARKTAWQTPPGSRFYSGTLGPVGSAWVAFGFALATAGLTAAVFRPWQIGASGPLSSAGFLPYLALGLPLAGLLLFQRRRRASWPVPLGMGFVAASYLSLTIQAAS